LVSFLVEIGGLARERMRSNNQLRYQPLGLKGVLPDPTVAGIAVVGGQLCSPTGACANSEEANNMFAKSTTQGLVHSFLIAFTSALLL
jgi:hypothetical protein